jgi:phosphatidylinositol 3-kinase
MHAIASPSLAHVTAPVSNDVNATTQEGFWKEYSFLTSAGIPLEIQLSVGRLQLPRDVNLSLFPPDVFITCDIICHELTTQTTPINTHFGILDVSRMSFIWDSLVSFSVKFRDLSRDAKLQFTARSSDGTALGATTLALFNEDGVMLQGKQKLLFYFLDPVGDIDTTVLYKNMRGELYSEVAKFDDAFASEKSFEAYQTARSSLDRDKPAARIDWLDRLAVSTITSNMKACDAAVVGGSGTLSSVHNAAPVRAPAHVLHRYCYLEVELPTLALPVIYEDSGSGSHVATAYCPGYYFDTFVTPGGCMVENERGVYEFSLQDRIFSGQSLCNVVDWDMTMDNAAEDMFRVLTQNDSSRGASDPNLKPDLQEKEKIDRIIRSPGDSMKPLDMDLIYKFRYALTENKNALTKFLLSLHWDNATEVAELPKLLALWKSKSPIDVSAALKLLSGGKAFMSPLVRKYAVEVLDTATDAELQTLLLQLVQALRYEPNLEGVVATMGTSPPTPAPAAAAEEDSQQPVHISEMQEQAIWCRTILEASPLACYLIQRACSSYAVANFLYWYLKVESEDEYTGKLFLAVHNCFLLQLEKGSADVAIEGADSSSAALRLELKAQNDYMDQINLCQRAAKDERGKKEAKEVFMRKMLQSTAAKAIPNGLSSVALPLDPDVQLLGMNPMKTFLFKSAMYPAVVEFVTMPTAVMKSAVSGGGPAYAPGEEGADTGAHHGGVKPKILKVIFKSGDDLRQDQLVMQMINLMDSLLKKVNLDLKLLTYGILATGQKDGMMEFVAGSAEISAVLSKDGSILNFLRRNNPDRMGPYGVSAKCMDLFTRSCAGSCVVTYILGIGDRHLENIMVTQEGQLFHLDFGFILGRDPKPFPPPFRLTRAMVDAMGGMDSEYYHSFKTYCCQAFNWLRKSAFLILNLLSLMRDANIPDMSIHSKPDEVLKLLEERLRLDLTDEEADQFFLTMISSVLTAIAPRVMDFAHAIAVSRR